MRAAPDGYTLLVTGGTFVTGYLFDKLSYEPSQGLRADLAHAPSAEHPRGAPVAAGEIGEGPDRARESKTRPAQLRLQRRRLDQPSFRGIVQVR